MQRVEVILHFEKHSVTIDGLFFTIKIDGLHLHHKYQKSFTEIGVNMRRLYKRMKFKAFTSVNFPPLPIERKEKQTSL
jgi:hypothetical protein